MLLVLSIQRKSKDQIPAFVLFAVEYFAESKLGCFLVMNVGTLEIEGLRLVACSIASCRVKCL